MQAVHGTVSKIVRHFEEAAVCSLDSGARPNTDN